MSHNCNTKFATYDACYSAWAPIIGTPPLDNGFEFIFRGLVKKGECEEHAKTRRMKSHSESSPYLWEKDTSALSLVHNLYEIPLCELTSVLKARNPHFISQFLWCKVRRTMTGHSNWQQVSHQANPISYTRRETATNTSPSSPHLPTDAHSAVVLGALAGKLKITAQWYK